MEPKMTVSEAAAFLNISTQAIHKRIKSKGLPIRRKQNRFYFGYETAKLLFELAFPNKVVVTQNIKGGVGKTELTFCIAIRANLYGARVLCIDLDMQGNLTKGCFKVNPKDKPIMVDVIKQGIAIEDAIINILPGLDLIPSSLDNGVLDNIIMLGRYPLDRIYRDQIEKIKQSYDLILIDCPPSLTASVTAAALASDEVLAPVTPDEHAISGLNLLNNEIKEIENRYHTHINLKIVFNKFDIRTNLSNEKLEDLKNSDEYGEKLYNSYVRFVQDFPNAIEHGQTIFDTFRATAAKEDVDLVTRELLGIEENNKSYIHNESHFTKQPENQPLGA
jgi:chromosome partitioning protein